MSPPPKKNPNKNINLMIVTNNSIFPNEKWREYLTRFKSLNYNVSIDGINDVAEFVRYGTKWSRFERNFDKQLKHFFVIPHYVFHTLNSTDLTDTIKWQKNLSLIKRKRKQSFHQEYIIVVSIAGVRTHI